MKFVVWIREKGRWVEQGDGPLPEKTAQRIAREIREDFGIGTKVLPEGIEPLKLEAKL